LGTPPKKRMDFVTILHEDYIIFTKNRGL